MVLSCVLGTEDTDIRGFYIQGQPRLQWEIVVSRNEKEFDIIFIFKGVGVCNLLLYIDSKSNRIERFKCYSPTIFK